MDWNHGRTTNFGAIASYEYEEKEAKRLEEKEDRRYREEMDLQREFLKVEQEKSKSMDRLSLALEGLAKSISEAFKNFDIK